MKLFLCLVFIFLSSSAFYTQIMRFNKSKITFPGNDTLLVYNDGYDTLTIDNIYSKNHLGYTLFIFTNHKMISYNIFSEADNPLNLLICPNDSARFAFSYPDLCPVCKKLPKVNTFTDTLVFKSNSIDTSFSYLGVEGPGTVDVDEKHNTTNTFFLSQNYPNPFNPVTTISFSIPEDQIVELTVYNVLGTEVKVLLNEYRSAGTYKELFNANSLSSGVYFYKLKAGSFIQTKKFILIR
jgi:hypothetical protein